MQDDRWSFMTSWYINVLCKSAVVKPSRRGRYDISHKKSNVDYSDDTTLN